MSLRDKATSIGVNEDIIQKVGEFWFTLLGNESTYTRYGTPRFVILTAGRTGSTFLCDYLSSHPRVKCSSELLIRARRRPTQFLSGVAASYLKSDICWGFKVKLTHIRDRNNMQPSNFFDWLADNNFKIIHLKRNDILRASVSACLGFVRGSYHDPSNFKPILDPELVLSTYKSNCQIVKGEQELLKGRKFIECSFEDHIQNPENLKEWGQEFCDFMNMDYSTMHSSPHKVNGNSIFEEISNASEVVNYLLAKGVNIRDEEI